MKEEHNLVVKVGREGEQSKITSTIGKAHQVGDIIVKILAQVRSYKSKEGLAMNSPLESLLILNDTSIDLSGGLGDLQNVTCAKEIQVYNKGLG